MGIYGNSKETSGTDAKSEHTKVKMIITTMIIVMIIMTIFLCISITACSMKDFFLQESYSMVRQPPISYSVVLKYVKYLLERGHYSAFLTPVGSV